MDVLRDYASVPDELKGSALAIGNFDGVHRGHQAVIAHARKAASDADAPAGVMVFEPHPRQFFERNRTLFRLTPLALKLDLFRQLDLDYVVVLDFDAALASLDAEQFVRDVLVSGLAVSHVVTGLDFKFGRGRGGSAETLSELGGDYGFTASAVAPVGENDEVFSSSRVRAALRQADVRGATEMLGYWWRMRGIVRSGEGRGHGLGYPTANLGVPEGMDLAHGIYAVRVWIEGKRIDGAAYLGTRPTFDGKEPFVEAFLFDFDGDIYGAEIDIEFIAFLREDKRYSDPEALSAQIAKDCEAARQTLASVADDDPVLAHSLGKKLAAGAD